ncbi:MAG: DUF4870 domain-containing protein [Gammaproteobacteria bacterium]|nr:DUF4870 domain-containing protein [Pseudomonadales bacterium]MCP5345252.1 DUF4870 domain-containing protein [Pseudomonadales bacterium]
MSQKSLGVDENVAALLAYVLGWISGLVVILMEKQNGFVRFHAMQSIITFGVITLLNVLFTSFLVFLIFLVPLLNLLALVLWIVLMVKAYQGERFALPVIGALAEEWSGKVDL